MANLTDRMFDAMAAAAASSRSDEEVLGRAVADTLAAAAAGFCVREVQAVSREGSPTAASSYQSWDASRRVSEEDAALVNGMACHALDFDDLDLDSSAHLNAVLLPAMLSQKEWPAEAALFEAMRAGMAAARFIATEVGPAHYERGWHSTSTIGTLATTAALTRVAGLSREASRHALAIGASQAGGLRANFGTTAKPLHTGFAAAAAVRSIRLAALGITGARDILASSSFRNAFASTTTEPARVADDERSSGTLPKLFPCCFASHRAILAALEARRSVPQAILAPDTRFVLTMPQGHFDIVSIEKPRSPSEAAFSVTYAVAAALLDGEVDLRHFDEEFGRPDVMALAARIEVHAERGAERGQVNDLVTGEAALHVVTGSGQQHRFVRSDLPGHGPDGAAGAPWRAKIASCLARFENSYGATFPVLARLRAFPHVTPWLPSGG